MKYQNIKKRCLLYICLCVSLCACHGTAPEDEAVFQESDQSDVSEKELEFLNKYNDIFISENAKRTALIYLDADSIPELLILKNGEYRLYTFDGSEVKAIAMPDTEIKANAYGYQHNFEDWEYQTFYWFEYVPYKGLIRVHSGADEERDDYYLKYADGLLATELEVRSDNLDLWITCDAEGEITNEDFLSRLSDLGYDQLIPCGYFYETVSTAYENIDAVPNTKKVLDDFVNGKVDALDHVEETGDIPEESFVMRRYEDYFEHMTGGDEAWIEAVKTEYADFDNDGEDELVMHGFAGACLVFDCIGDTVYKVLETGTTTDVASVAVFHGEKVIKRTDLGHVERKYYWIMKFDSCCCLIDWFSLYATYEGTKYSKDDEFMYREREISMEQFEEIVNGIE